jgi:hypothetical protein
VGEAKRRKPRQDLGPNGHMISADSPEVRALLEDGQLINVNLFGAAAIQREVLSRTFDELMAPERHAFRLAFQMFDRMRTGEIEPWSCALCAREHAGLRWVSVLAVIECALGDSTLKKPGIVAPICQACDSASTAETVRRIQAAFGLYSLQVGTA